MIQQFTKYGYSFCAFKAAGGTTGAPTALTTAYQAFPITVDAANSVTSKGGASFSSLVDYHFDGGTSSGGVTTAITNTSRGILYVIAKQTGGTNARGNIRVSWRS